MKPISCLPLMKARLSVKFPPDNGRETVEKQFYLQMIDVLFCIKVYPPSFLFNGHDRESDIDASMDLPFLNLKSRD